MHVKTAFRHPPAPAPALQDITLMILLQFNRRRPSAQHAWRKAATTANKAPNPAEEQHVDHGTRNH
jgi:hypothetical protein